MSPMTPEEEAARALANNLYRSQLSSRAAIDAYDRMTAERAAERAGTNVLLRDAVYFGGYSPSPDLRVGVHFDLRFLEASLGVYRPGTSDLVLDIAYPQVEALEISGPGRVTSGGGFVGGGFGLAGSVEGMAIAGILNALTTKTTVRTMLRIQAPSCELFMMSSQIEPQPLRIALSRPLAAIRRNHAVAAPALPASPATELHKLTDLLDRHLLSREEFDRLKARIVEGG